MSACSLTFLTSACSSWESQNIFHEVKQKRGGCTSCTGPMQAEKQELSQTPPAPASFHLGLIDQQCVHGHPSRQGDWESRYLPGHMIPPAELHPQMDGAVWVIRRENTLARRWMWRGVRATGQYLGEGRWPWGGGLSPCPLYLSLHFSGPGASHQCSNTSLIILFLTLFVLSAPIQTNSTWAK